MIIGLQIGSTSGCAVWNDGKVVFAASEERYTNRKNDSGYPEYAIEAAKRFCGITPKNIEKIVMPSQKMTPVHFLCNIGDYGIGEYLREEHEYYKPLLLDNQEINYLDVFRDRCATTPAQELLAECRADVHGGGIDVWNRWRKKQAAEIFGVSQSKIEILNHETSHAAYAFYGSPWGDYGDVLCVEYDGYGDDCNAGIFVYENGIRKVASYQNFNVGRIYRYITLLLGMKPGEHEYKVMGLAPYATEHVYSQPLEVFRKAYRFDDGQVVIDPELHDNYFYFRERLEGMRFDGIAGALQIFTEEMASKLVSYWLQRTGKHKVLLSGGCSMNIKANMVIGQLEGVSDLFVVGSSGDESLAIGAIYNYVDQHKLCGVAETSLPDLYLGDEIEAREVEEIIGSLDLNKYRVLSHPCPSEIARLLADGMILGRVSGRMEFGARALGNRSILADPRHDETVQKINKKIKNRDFWMPFTPSILKEDAEKYLINPKQFQFPFMSVGCDTTEIGRQKLQAALHPSDLTARPQLVTREMNPEYYELIKAFREITGVGALLNTSLNIHGYPIARNAKDALWVMENSQLDGLIFDGYVILRN